MRIVTPITLSNNQSQPTPANFQQLIQTTIQYPNGVRFWSPTDGWLYAWLENISNGTATIWVKIPSFIPANGTYQLYMIQDSTLPMDGVYWGEAPQLSPTYGEYDNGNEIFPYYQRFGGLSSLPPNWSSVSGTGLTFASTYIEIEANQTTDGWYGIYLNPIPSSLASTTTVWEFYGNIYNTAQTNNYAGTMQTSVFNANYGYTFAGGYNPDIIHFVNANNQFYSTNYADTNNNKIYTMQMSSATSLQMLVNYTQIYSTTSATPVTLSYFQFGTSNGLPNYGIANPIYVYWLRTRAYPPNGVMPTASFGASQYSGELITVTVP